MSIDAPEPTPPKMFGKLAIGDLAALFAAMAQWGVERMKLGDLEVTMRGGGAAERPADASADRRSTTVAGPEQSAAPGATLPTPAPDPDGLAPEDRAEVDLLRKWQTGEITAAELEAMQAKEGAQS